MNNLATDIKIAPSGGFSGFGKLGLQGEINNDPIGNFTGLISSVIGIMTLVAIIWFIFLLISGAISYMSSGGEKGAIESARKKITNALVGLVIVIISIFIIKLVGYLMGIPDILDFPGMFMTIFMRGQA